MWTDCSLLLGLDCEGGGAHASALTGSGSDSVVVKGRVFVFEVEEVCLAPSVKIINAINQEQAASVQRPSH